VLVPRSPAAAARTGRPRASRQAPARGRARGTRGPAPSTGRGAVRLADV
jgi:hypothetical protein